MALHFVDKLNCKTLNMRVIFGLMISLLFLLRNCNGTTEEDEGVKYANKCEVCKILAVELESRLEETGKTHDVIEIGYSLDDVKPKKKFQYKKSELRLVESLEGICDRILEYNIHKEREDSTRFAKGMSQTFQTLHDLVDKGVKVDLGIPYELWDKPSIEITNMKSQCETLLEVYESDIEDWYWKRQGDIPLKTFLCSQRALKGSDDSCLNETVKESEPEPEQESERGGEAEEELVEEIDEDTEYEEEEYETGEEYEREEHDEL